MASYKAVPVKLTVEENDNTKLAMSLLIFCSLATDSDIGSVFIGLDVANAVKSAFADVTTNFNASSLSTKMTMNRCHRNCNISPAIKIQIKRKTANMLCINECCVNASAIAVPKRVNKIIGVA